MMRGNWMVENWTKDTAEEQALSKYSYPQKEVCLIKGTRWICLPIPGNHLLLLFRCMAHDSA